ncbi:MAG: glycosyltransferase family 39 protein [Acidobacteriia bacterium]|nr:glycosyltransferase family 39 protein [Terriglobia bacterium]
MKRAREWTVLALLLAAAAVILARSAYNASNLDVVPDSVELALGAEHFVADGRFAIEIDGRTLPSRYPPWFSVAALAPAYLLLGPEPGNAIYPVTAFAVAGIALAYALGRRAAGTWGGASAATALLALPVYRLWGRQIMSDVPAAAVMLAVCLVYVRGRASSRETAAGHFLAGCLIAIGALFRPVCAAALLPFLLCAFSPPGAAKRLLLLLGPLGAAAAMTLAYNGATFGSVARSGYPFWCPVPYDYPSLTFSTAYVRTNLTALWYAGLPLLIAGVASALVIDRRLRAAPPASVDAGVATVRSLVEFLVLATGPIVLFHLLYFFPHPRFYLPSVAVAAVLLGSVAGGWLSRLRGWTLPAILALGLLAVSAWRAGTSDQPPYRRMVADRIRQLVPERAIVVSAIEPAYLGYFLGASGGRRAMPISRRVEYADKLIARHRIPDPSPPPRRWNDHRCPGLLAGGAEEAVRAVASERLGDLEAAITAGVPVFLDTSFTTRADQELLDTIRRRFDVVQRAGMLYELRPRTGTPFRRAPRGVGSGADRLSGGDPPVPG